jgi:hypothetical protein
MIYIAAGVLLLVAHLGGEGMPSDCQVGHSDSDVRILVRGQANAIVSISVATLGGVACSDDRVVTYASFPRESSTVSLGEHFERLMVFQWSGDLCSDSDEAQMSFLVFHELKMDRCLLEVVPFFGTTHILDMGSKDFSNESCNVLPSDPCDPQ